MADTSIAMSTTTLEDNWYLGAAPRPTTRRRKHLEETPNDSDWDTMLSTATSATSMQQQPQVLSKRQLRKLQKKRPKKLTQPKPGRGGGDEFFEAALNRKLRATLAKLYGCLKPQLIQPCRDEFDTCLSEPVCLAPLEDIDCGVKKLACVLLAAADRMPPGKCHGTRRCTSKMGCGCPRCRDSNWLCGCCEMLRYTIASVVEGLASVLSCIFGCKIHSLVTGRFLCAVADFIRPARVAAVRERMCQVSQIYQRVRERLRPENVILFSRVVTLVHARLEEHERAACDRPRPGEWVYDEVGGCYDDRGGYYDSYGGYYDSSGGYYDEFGGYYDYNGHYFQAGRR